MHVPMTSKNNDFSFEAAPLKQKEPFAFDFSSAPV
jgi:hypothetical protein